MPTWPTSRVSIAKAKAASGARRPARRREDPVREVVEAEPERFFKPPYVGTRGWIGLRLDGPIDWKEVTAVVEDAYRTIAPAKLVAELDARRGP